MLLLLQGHRFDCVHIQNSTLAGGVVMGVAAGLDMHPAAPIGIGFVIGGISVLGYKYMTPFLSGFGIQVCFQQTNVIIDLLVTRTSQDICGIHNLHGMPGVIGAFVSIWATLGLSYDSSQWEQTFGHGQSQAGIQAAACAITIRK